MGDGEKKVKDFWRVYKDVVAHQARQPSTTSAGHGVLVLILRPCKRPWQAMGSGLAIIQNHTNSLQWERHYG